MQQFSFWLHSVIQDNPTSEDCRVIQFKNPIVNRILLGHVIDRVLVKSELGCEAHCFENDDCMSVNFGPLEGSRVPQGVE